MEVKTLAVSASQEAVFTAGTLGFTMADFRLTILLVLFTLLYLWAIWVVVTQWKSFSNRKISFYDFLMRCVRCVLVTIFASFLLT